MLTSNTSFDANGAVSLGPDAGQDGSAVTIPDAHFLFHAEFKRTGSDLALVGEDGQRIVVPGYFNSDQPAALFAPDGTMLSGETITALVKSHMPAHYAQAGAPAAAAPQIGAVDKVSGGATVIRNGASVALNAGDQVLKGDVILTSDGASVAIMFVDGTALNLGANTRMVMNEFVFNPNSTTNSSLLSLVTGSFAFVSGEVAKTGGLTFETPVATMGIRGTTGGAACASSCEFTATQDFRDGHSSTYTLTYGGQVIGTVRVENNTIVGPSGPGQIPVVSFVAAGNNPNLSALGQQLATNYPQMFVPPPTAPTTPGPQQQQNNGGGGSSTPPPEQPLANVPPPTIVLVQPPAGSPPGAAPVPIIVVFNNPVVVTTPPPSNQPPVFDNPIANRIVDSNHDFSFTLAGTFSDPDTPTSALNVTASLADGSPLPVWLTFNPADQTFSGTPPADFAGVVTLRVVVDDGTSSVANLFALTVNPIENPVNVAPVVVTTANPAPPVVTANGSPTVIDATLTVSDIDSATLAGATVTIAAGAQSGDTLAIGGATIGTLVVGGGRTIQFNYDSNTHVLTLSGLAALSDYQAVLRAVSFANTGDHVANSTRTITFQVNDGSSDHNVSGIATSTIALNHSPMALADADVVTEDGLSTVISGDLLFNDTDVDSADTHTVNAVAGATDNGTTFTVVGTYGTLVIDKATGAYTYTLANGQANVQALAAGQTVTDVFNYTNTDNHGGSASSTLTISVTGSNDGPVAVADVGSISENAASTAVSGNVLGNDTDTDSADAHSVTAVAGATDNGTTFTVVGIYGTLVVDRATGAYTYTLASGQANVQVLANGQTVTDVFNYTNTDNHGASASSTLTISVTGSNDAPTIDLTPTITEVPIPDLQQHPGTNLAAHDYIGPAISHDGRWVVFFSDQGAGGNQTNAGDEFLYDRLTGVTTVLTDDAHFSNSGIDRPDGEHYTGFSISADGSTVVFRGTHVVENESGPSEINQIYVYDRATDTVRVLANPNTDHIYSVNDEPRIAGGNLIVFAETEFGFNNALTFENFAFGPPSQHLLVTDLGGNIRTELTLASLGIPDPNESDPSLRLQFEQPDISPNGRYLTFWMTQHQSTLGESGPVGPDTPVGDATLYTYDRSTNTLQFIATSTATDDQWWASMSNDGRFVVFQSDSDTLDEQVGGIANNTLDVFVFDREEANNANGGIIGITDRHGFQASYANDAAGSGRASISPNGRFVIFASDATNLVPGDTNGLGDTFVYDLQTQTFTRVSLGPDGATQGDGDSIFGADIGFGGNFAAFGSKASNFVVPAESDQTSDIFIVDRSAGTVGVVVEDDTTPGTASGSAPANTLSTHGAFRFNDIDLNDAHSIRVTGVTIDTSNAPPGFTIPADGFGTFTPTLIDSTGSGQGQIAWDFVSPNIQELNAFQQVRQTYTVEIDDGHGGVITQNVLIAIAGRGDAPVITGAIATGTVPSGALTPAAASYLTASHDLINGLGGSAGFGENTLAGNDDGSTGAINLDSIFGAAGLNFFGTTYHSLFINNNGNVTFNSPSSTFTPFQINAGTSPIIAPFLADVDTRGGSTSPTSGGHSTGSNLVYWHNDSSNHVLTVTWDDVGYFGSHKDHLNAFQLQLIGLGNGDFDIVFRYEDINWTTGDASGGSGGFGGTVAHAGYSAGDGNASHFFELSQSGNQSAMLNLEGTAGHTGIAGVEVFQVQSGNVTAAPVANGAIQFADPDFDDVHTATAQNAETGYLGTFTLDAVDEANDSVAWHFALNSNDVNSFFDPAAAQVRQQFYDVTISDGHPGGSATGRVGLSVGSTANDTFVFASGAGQELVFNFATSGSLDSIDLQAFAEVNLNLQSINNNHDTLIDLGHGDSVTLIGVQPGQLVVEQHVIHSAILVA